MNGIKSREEFERNFFLLKEKLPEMFFSKETNEAKESLMKVRYLPNKRIDFLTVNESARLLANTSTMFDSELIKNKIKK